MVSSGDEATSQSRLRSHGRSRRGGPDSTRTSRSRSQDSEPKDFSAREAAGGGTSDVSLEHPPSSPEQRTTAREEEPQDRAETEAVQPSLDTWVRQREPSPGSEALHRRGSPSSAVRHGRESSHDRDARDGSLNATEELGRLEKERLRVRETTLRRRERLRRMQRELEEVERAGKATATTASRRREAVTRAKQTRKSDAAATPSPLSREQDVNSRSKRPGDDGFFKGCVVSMASSPWEEVSTELAYSVLAKASALLVSVRKASQQPTELLSVERSCLKWTTPRIRAKRWLPRPSPA